MLLPVLKLSRCVETFALVGEGTDASQLMGGVFETGYLIWSSINHISAHLHLYNHIYIYISLSLSLSLPISLSPFLIASLWATSVVRCWAEGAFATWPDKFFMKSTCRLPSTQRIKKFGTSRRDTISPK